jgi:hypothetical protein
MTKFIPYLDEKAIERNAAALLAEYAQARGLVISSLICRGSNPPAPASQTVSNAYGIGSRRAVPVSRSATDLPRVDECVRGQSDHGDVRGVGRLRPTMNRS